MQATDVVVQAVSPSIQRPPRTVMKVSTSKVDVGEKYLRVKGAKFMYKYQGTISAGSTPSFTCSLVNDQEVMFPSAVYYKVQAQNLEYDWIDVGPVNQLEHPSSTFNIVLSPEQTSALDVNEFSDNRRLILQTFYADNNGTVMNNTESIEFKITTLPVLAEQYEQQPPAVEFAANVYPVIVNHILGVWEGSIETTLPVGSSYLELYAVNSTTGDREEIPVQVSTLPNLTRITFLFKPSDIPELAEYELTYRVTSLGGQVLTATVPLVLTVD